MAFFCQSIAILSWYSHKLENYESVVIFKLNILANFLDRFFWHLAGACTLGIFFSKHCHYFMKSEFFIFDLFQIQFMADFFAILTDVVGFMVSPGHVHVAYFSQSIATLSWYCHKLESILHQWRSSYLDGLGRKRYVLLFFIRVLLIAINRVAMTTWANMTLML